MSTVSLTPDLDLLPAREVRTVSRRRTVSCSLEHTVQNKRLVSLGVEKKSNSCADNLTMYNYLPDLQPEEEDSGQRSLASRVPCLGILLVVMGVSVFQGSSVLAKKMSVHPMMTILYGDILKFFYSAPFAVYGGDNPFPRGKIHLVVARGIFAGLQLMGHFYAIKYLPISDITMISSIKPVFSTLLACIFLKESCGPLEILNLVLVVSGIALVVQPDFIFGETESQDGRQVTSFQTKHFTLSVYLKGVRKNDHLNGFYKNFIWRISILVSWL